MHSLFLLSAGVFTGHAAAAIQGFASGSSFIDGTPKTQAEFEAEFKAAQSLKGAPGTFNSVRLYTNIQGGSTSDPISAFPAAIATNTSILLGIWCSGTSTITNELTALTAAINKYGTPFTQLVRGISVGSEDLYRNSVQGAVAKAGIGANPDVLVNFIKQTRSAIAGTGLSSIPVGHVDTWDVWGNSSNKAVLDAIDWVGVDAYPYFESDRGNNSIGNAVAHWEEAINGVKNTIGSKPYWVTETGWPTTGPTYGYAVASVENAKAYWDAVGCAFLFGQINTWWYTMYDANPVDKAKFAVTDNFSTTPYYNLTCPAKSSTTSSTSSASASGSSTSGSSSTLGSTGNSTSTSGGTSTRASASASKLASASSSASVVTTNAAPSNMAMAPGSVLALVLAAIAALAL